MPFSISSPGWARNPELLLMTPILTTVWAAAGAASATSAANPDSTTMNCLRRINPLPGQRDGARSCCLCGAVGPEVTRATRPAPPRVTPRETPRAYSELLGKARHQALAVAARREAALAQRRLGDRQRRDIDRAGADEGQARNRELGETAAERLRGEQLDAAAVERDDLAPLAR